MSLTTVAAPARPDKRLALLPPSKPERFLRSDFIGALLVFAVTLGVYIATLAPSVTLEDSGELITGAAHFGVPHPPGYPLWTMSGFIITHVIPFGSIAWRMNLQSALFAATANALITLLVCHSGRWLLQRWTDANHQPVARQFSFYAGVLCGFTLGFSDVMWSQGVIAEVYTLHGLFVNLTLLSFYLWILEPEKTERLIITVFIFCLGLTNHHTLIQMMPGILIAAVLLRAGKFWSLFIAINLFSLSLLVYLAWLSVDLELRAVAETMTYLIFGMVGVVSFFYLREFRWKLFLAGAALLVAFFAYGHYFFTPVGDNLPRYTLETASYLWQWGSLVHPDWLQITGTRGILLLIFGAAAVGLYFTSTLDRRILLGVFAAGWVGLSPYSYERFASSTLPPMNWSTAVDRAGFYYSITRQQYPLTLPSLIKDTIGKAIGVVPRTETDPSLARNDYFHKLWLTFYYYVDNTIDNFTLPLIFLTLANLLYLWRSDGPQKDWFIFLGVAFFFLGFMLHLISPPDSFDYQSNLQYKVFYLPSHCIFVLFLGYGALAAMVYLNEVMPEVTGRFGALGLGMPALYLSLLPLWSNFDDGNQAEHWYGYNFGADIMRSMDKNAVYYGGSDFGRFVPTFFAFVESQQSDRWKREPGFDRRDVTVITQNALCDTFYSKYIRDQYDPRFRTKPGEWTTFEKWLGRDTAYPTIPVICQTPAELSASVKSYEDAHMDRIKAGIPLMRPGTDDIFELNGVVAFDIFQKNKKDHTFYLEQSIPMQWTYPYLIPCGLIFQLSKDPMASLSTETIEADRKYWDDYSTKLLNDPRFHLDDDAMLTYGKLAFWHADLYRWRGLEKEQEYWLKISTALCPPLADPARALAQLYVKQHRYDEAVAISEAAEAADSRSESFPDLVKWTTEEKHLAGREAGLRATLAKSPYDLQSILELAQVLDQQGRMDEVCLLLRTAAGLSNWSHAAEAEVIQYYVVTVHHPEAAIAFLEVRAKIDPQGGPLIYTLAALHASMNHADQAIAYLSQAAGTKGGTNALRAAMIDPNFQPIQHDPRFQALTSGRAPVSSNAVAKPPTNALATPASKAVAH